MSACAPLKRFGFEPASQPSRRGWQSSYEGDQRLGRWAEGRERICRARTAALGRRAEQSVRTDLDTNQSGDVRPGLLLRNVFTRRPIHDEFDFQSTRDSAAR